MNFSKLLFSGLLTCAPFVTHAIDLDSAKAEAQKLTQEKIMTPDMVALILDQNKKHASLTEGEIQELDQKWRAEAKAGSGSMIDGVLSNAGSEMLKKLKESSGGKFAEIFVMDNKGLNVAQSDVTSDYWQGDESKFQETYPFGADGVFMDTVEFDESTGKYTAQVSVSVADPATGQAIGAVTYGYIFE